VKNRFQNSPFKCNLQRYTVDGVDGDVHSAGWQLGCAAVGAAAGHRVGRERMRAGGVEGPSPRAEMVGRYKLNSVDP
jgi:hypothetical protein